MARVYVRVPAEAILIQRSAVHCQSEACKLEEKLSLKTIACRFYVIIIKKGRGWKVLLDLWCLNKQLGSFYHSCLHTESNFINARIARHFLK
jgi:hypothetical protein